MLNNKFLTGTTLNIYAELKNESGYGVTTTGLTFYMTEPGGIGSTYYFGSGSGSGNSEPVQAGISTGIYYKQWTPTRTGVHKFSWKATGSVQATFKSFFNVESGDW